MCVRCSDVARASSIASIVNAFFWLHLSLTATSAVKHTHTHNGGFASGRRTDHLNHLTRSEHAHSFSVTSVVLGVCVFVIVVSHQLILRGLESKLLARRVAAAPCSPPRGRTLVSGRQQPQRAGTRQQRDPVGAIETSTATGARYMTSFLCIRRARFVGKHLNVILLLMLVLRCVFTTRRHWVSSHGLPAARGE